MSIEDLYDQPSEQIISFSVESFRNNDDSPIKIFIKSKDGTIKAYCLNRQQAFDFASELSEAAMSSGFQTHVKKK